MERRSLTSSLKGNDRSHDSKSSKYFEWFSSKRFSNWSRAAISTVYGWIRPNFSLIQDYIVVLVTCKNEDPIKNEGARVLARLYIDFSDTQGVKSVVEFRQKSNSSKLLWLSLLPARMRKIQSKIKALEC